MNEILTYKYKAMDLFKLKTFIYLVDYSKKNKDAGLALLLSHLAEEARTSDEPSINNDAVLGVSLPSKAKIQASAILYSSEKHGADYSMDTVDDFIEGVKYLQGLLTKGNDS